MKKPRWRIRYVPWGGRREVVRLFPTERGARAFYRRILRRPEPPVSQTIERTDQNGGVGR